MARVRIHYESWVALPADLRRSLGLEVGSELQAEFIDGAIIMRPAKAADAIGSTKPERAGVATEAALAVPAPPAAAAVAPTLTGPTPDQVMPPAKRRGRPPKAAAEA